MFSFNRGRPCPATRASSRVDALCDAHRQLQQGVPMLQAIAQSGMVERADIRAVQQRAELRSDTLALDIMLERVSLARQAIAHARQQREIRAAEARCTIPPAIQAHLRSGLRVETKDQANGWLGDLLSRSWHDPYEVLEALHEAAQMPEGSALRIGEGMMKLLTEALGRQVNGVKGC